MAEVTAMAEVHAHELVARLKTCHEYSHVCLRSTMRLHVCPFSIEKLFGAFYCEVFSLVNHLATSVITVCRISFCIFICQAGTHCAHNLIAYKVLAGYEFDSTTLTQMLAINDVKNFVVSFHD